MPKTALSSLGSAGISYDADPADLKPNVMTDALNVRFAGREIEQGLGNAPEPYYTTDINGVNYPSHRPQLIQPMMYDGFSNGARVLYSLATREIGDPAVESFGLYEQNMANYNYREMTDASATVVNWPIIDRWHAYRGQLNNCCYFGMRGQAPVGKAYDWNGFDLLPGFGEQTMGDQSVVVRRWTAKNMIAFGNRLLLLNTLEEDAGGTDVPYPNRVRWSGFSKSGAFPINWDDTAANRPPEEYAAAVIDGYAGWMDIASESQLIDGCVMGGTLYLYSERSTFAVTITGNANSPFMVKQIYADLGCLDLGCVVNVKGYNYVFTGSDVVRHDAVRWESIADGICRDYLSEIVSQPRPGAVRMVSYPEINEIWVMTRGDDQEPDECSKTQCMVFNYVTNTWARKSLPYVNDVVFAPIAPQSELVPETWDAAVGEWDTDTEMWGGGELRIAQGALIGGCQAGGVYYMSAGYNEYRHVYSGGVWSMQVQPLHCYIERRGLDLADGLRSVVTRTELRGRGTGSLDLSIGYAQGPDGGYTWERQHINSLVDDRRHTWLIEGAYHAVRMEFKGQGAIPSTITIYHEESGE